MKIELHEIFLLQASTLINCRAWWEHCSFINDITFPFCFIHQFKFQFDSLSEKNGCRNHEKFFFICEIDKLKFTERNFYSIWILNHSAFARIERREKTLKEIIILTTGHVESHFGNFFLHAFLLASKTKFQSRRFSILQLKIISRDWFKWTTNW